MTRAAYSYRDDPAVPAFPDDQPVIVFDGECIFCSGCARFVLRHDRRRLFRLATAQSPLGRALYVHYGLEPDDYETNLLIEDGRAWTRSEGTIRMFEGLGPPWSAVAVARILPAPLRDALYEWVARNRYRLAGRRVACFLPSPADRERVIA